MAENAEKELSKTLQQAEFKIISELFGIFQEFKLNRHEAEMKTSYVLSGAWNALETRIRSLPPRRKAA